MTHTIDHKQSPKIDCTEIWGDFKDRFPKLMNDGKMKESDFPSIMMSIEFMTMLEFAWNRGYKRACEVNDE